MRSRSPKGQFPEDAFQAWQERAAAAGASPESWAPGPRPLPQAPCAETVGAVVQELTNPGSPRCLTQAAATFDTRTRRGAVAEAAQGRIVLGPRA